MHGMLKYGTPMGLEMPTLEIETEIADEVLPTRPQHPVEPQQKFRDAIVSRLTSAKVGTDELRRIRAELLGQVFDGALDLVAVDAFLELSQDEEQHALFEKHREIRARGRQQLEIVEQLGVKFGEALVEWNRLRVERDEAQFRFKVAVERRKNLDQFASDSQMRSADIRVVEAKKKNEAAWLRFSEAMGYMNSSGSELDSARAELNRIRDQEESLRSQILGEPYNDPELGLQVNPGGAN